MADHKRSKVTADIKRNRLNITLSSCASRKEAQKIYTDIRFCVADLKPGFDVVADYSHCTFAHLSAISTMQQIMEYLTAHHAGNIIRVVGKKSLIFKQMLHFINKFQSYTPIYVNTQEEVEEALTKLSKRNGLRFHLYGHQVKYTIDNETREGALVDISISGCAIQNMTAAPSIDQDISLVIPIDHGGDLPLSFTTVAKVVRVQDNLFAVQFLALDEEMKEQLFKWFAYGVCRISSFTTGPS